ncbi:unnamed protein product [Rangifer tarandus platyrhynchus]|uniref:Uncharacterized protein n=2 Tax=Rangifer tarandus platyrhynchus TaxID=3082113 RepID=A0ABN8YZ94_RANTA|nr:unnamed protein product [Rangifer tarandus platyrhynchus]CAI9702747.1 unnamed protein product [Rangifer tarandus platyrhynchus]
MRGLGLQTRPRSGLREPPTAARSPSPTAVGARGPNWTTRAATNRRGNSRSLTARLRPHVYASKYVITHERRIPDAPGPGDLGAGRESVVDIATPLLLQSPNRRATAHAQLRARACSSSLVSPLDRERSWWLGGGS